MARQNNIGSGLLCCIALILCINIRVSGSEDQEYICDRIFSLIYNQQYDEAGAELAKVRYVIDEVHYQILLMDLSWWKALSEEGDDDFRQLENVLNLYSNNLSDRREADKLQALICFSYSLRLAALRKRNFEMVLLIFKIENTIHRLNTDKLTPEQFDFFRVFSALFNIFKAELHVNKDRLRSESILVLHRFHGSSNIELRVISSYFLAKVYADIMATPREAIGLYEELCMLYPDNQIFAYNLNQCRMTAEKR